LVNAPTDRLFFTPAYLSMEAMHRAGDGEELEKD